METYKTLRELFMTLCNTEVDTAVILGHINPDGDAVGSVMGVAYYLRENFPCKFREIIPYTAPGLAKGVQNYVEQDTTFDPFALLEGRVPKDRPYVAIACDCAAPDRIAGEEWFRRSSGPGDAGPPRNQYWLRGRRLHRAAFLLRGDDRPDDGFGRAGPCGAACA